jgi:hypothetical protein
MFRKGEIKTSQNAFEKHTNKSINALLEGAAVATFANIFFSLQHILPIISPEFSNTQKITALVAPLAYAIVEHYRQTYLANKALVNGEKDASKIGIV